MLLLLLLLLVLGEGWCYCRFDSGGCDDDGDDVVVATVSAQPLNACRRECTRLEASAEPLGLIESPVKWVWFEKYVSVSWFGAFFALDFSLYKVDAWKWKGEATSR